MNARTLGILVAAAAILALLAILGQGRGGNSRIAGESAGTLVLPGLGEELEEIREILVSGQGRETLASITRTETGWVVADMDGYPADTSRVNALLIALAEARVVEEKTANPEFHSRLGVESIDTQDAAGIELELVPESGSPYSIVLGDPYGNGQRYVRLADENLSLLIDRSPDVARSAADWVSAGIIDIAGTRVQRVEIAHADGERLVVSKATREDPNFAVENVPDGRELQYASIANVTGNALQGLRLEEVAGAGSDAITQTPLAVSEFWTFDGLVITVTATDGGGDEPWLTFGARYEVDQALAFSSAPSESVSDTFDNADGGEQNENAIVEAEAINARLSAWRYRIPSFKYTQLTRRMEDLLRAETGSDD